MGWAQKVYKVKPPGAWTSVLWFWLGSTILLYWHTLSPNCQTHFLCKVKNWENLIQLTLTGVELPKLSSYIRIELNRVFGKERKKEREKERMEINKNKYSIIVPTYNERLNIALLVYLVFKHLRYPTVPFPLFFGSDFFRLSCRGVCIYIIYY